MSIFKKIFPLITFLNRLLPKKNKVLFLGGGDNTEALYRYCDQNTDLNIICLARKHMTYSGRKGSLVKTRKHINYLFEFLTSKVIVNSYTDTLTPCVSKNQYIIQLWHGSPLKIINRDPSRQEGKYYKYFLTASDLFRKEFMNSHGMEKNVLLVSGYPRCDYLFHPFGDVSDFHLNKRNIIWMPTYRHGIDREETKKDLPILDSENITILAETLKNNDTKLFIKAHRLQERSYEQILGNCNYDNIELMSDDQLLAAGIPLYVFLGRMDALITDYSSVFFDYLLLDRPIGFAIDDMEEYKENRGFAFENPIDLMPGEKLYTIDDLICFIFHLTNGQDDWKFERSRVNNLVNYYQDDQNCKRCTELVKSLLNV